MLTALDGRMSPQPFHVGCLDRLCRALGILGRSTTAFQAYISGSIFPWYFLFNRERMEALFYYGVMRF